MVKINKMLVAVVILGILAAIATVVIRRIINNSRVLALFGSFDNVVTGVRADVMVGSSPVIGTDTGTDAYNYTTDNYH